MYDLTVILRSPVYDLTVILRRLRLRSDRNSADRDSAFFHVLHFYFSVKIAVSHDAVYDLTENARIVKNEKFKN